MVEDAVSIVVNRRRYLTLLGASAVPPAGCVGVENLTATTPDDVPEDAQRVLAVANRDDGERDVSLDVELVRPYVTPDDAAHLRVTVTNEGPVRALGPSTEISCDPFGRDQGGSAPEGLRLKFAPVHDAVIIRGERDGDRWSLDRDPKVVRGVGLKPCSTPEYDEGEAVEFDYFVWDDYRTSGYFEPGTYRFETEVSIRDPPDSGNYEYAEWGFELRVERPE